jgi:hypothetical protein
MAKRSQGYLKVHETVEMTLRGVTVWAYAKNNKYLGRVEVNRAGLSVATGKKGNKQLGNLSWKRLFEILENK